MKRRITFLGQYGRSSLMAFVLAVLTLGLLTAVAAAHALLVMSEPENGAMLAESPQRVMAWYSQELESSTSSMRVFDAEGGQVDRGDGGVDLNDPDHVSMMVTLPAALPAGSYTVRWTAVSVEDDDASEGEFAFGVAGEEGAATQTVAVQPLPEAADRSRRPLWWLAAGLMVLVVSATGLAIRHRAEDN